MMTIRIEKAISLYINTNQRSCCWLSFYLFTD
jgi:hypothetical protein